MSANGHANGSKAVLRAGYAPNRSATTTKHTDAHRQYCPILSFFHPETEELDLEPLKKHVVRLAQAGLVGLVAMGSNGEVRPHPTPLSGTPGLLTILGRPSLARRKEHNHPHFSRSPRRRGLPRRRPHRRLHRAVRLRNRRPLQGIRRRGRQPRAHLAAELL